MKKVVIASVLALASSTLYLPSAALAQDAAAGSQSGQITIKDPAEYNAYTSAIGQSAPAAKAAAIESFLQQYPNTVVKNEMLEQLVGAYQATGDTAKTYDAAKRLLQVDPTNLRALTFVVYVTKQQANGDQAKLDEAAAEAQKGLTATKPASMSDADFQKLKDVATPIFYNVIASDDVAKKDYKDAIEAYTSELKSAKDPSQTTQQPLLADTYYLGNAYVQEDPKDLVNGIWFLTRAAQYLPDPYKTNAEKAAEYWYNKYHGSMDGFDAIKALAHDNVFPTDAYKPVPAPPPPSPQQLAHNALTQQPDPTKLAIGDQEYILSNGNQEDAQKVWSVLQNQTTKIPGVVIAATADSVQLAVSDDSKQSQKADFTVNMKTPLKEVPTVGSTVTLIGTFDSYTQNPPMIIMKDGESEAAKTPVHHTTRRRQ
ncbi:tetratricopeptide repeat protein [Silvibacterium acidisoli]|uniref:tetratricopeptide repeat protein n=1 Tax=Acidobacteriaceae bacterium ZG23-2 TaxID=2883246 RepID=UPI00406D301B